MKCDRCGAEEFIYFIGDKGLCAQCFCNPKTLTIKKESGNED
jgi:hypothetical protein